MHPQKGVIRKQVLECLDHFVHSLGNMIDSAIYLIKPGLPFRAVFITKVNMTHPSLNLQVRLLLCGLTIATWRQPYNKSRCLRQAYGPYPDIIKV